MKNNLRTLVYNICINFKISKALLLDDNREIESVLNYYTTPYSVISSDCEENFCLNDAEDFYDFPNDFDLVFVPNYGSYIFRYRLVQYMADNDVKFIICESSGVTFRNSKYTIRRFFHNGVEFKVYYLDVLKVALDNSTLDPYDREFK